MKNKITTSSVSAEALNALVAEKLSEHLFLVCNYNPESFVVLNDDARFMQYALNLYKFLIDASICNNIRGIGRKYCLKYDFRKLESIITDVNVIRTVMGHNENQLNCTDEVKRNLENWFANVIAKTQPTTTEDYSKVVLKLQDYADESLEILIDFIEACSVHADKLAIISDWEEIILSFYKRTNSRNIFEGYLKLEYQSKGGPKLTATKLDVALWVQKMFFYKEETQNSLLYSALRIRGLKSEDSQKIQIKIKENQKVMNSRKDQVARHVKKSIDQLRPFDYWDYYIFIMPIKIEDTMRDGLIISLLPQYIVQQILEQDFKEIPI